MNRQQYRAARRLIRDNGYFALRWMNTRDAAVFDVLRACANSTDWLAERASILAYCRRQGLHCTVFHTAPPAVLAKFSARRA